MHTKTTFQATVQLTIDENWSNEASISQVTRDATRVARNILTTPDMLVEALTSGRAKMFVGPAVSVEVLDPGEAAK